MARRALPFAVPALFVAGYGAWWFEHGVGMAVMLASVVLGVVAGTAALVRAYLARDTLIGGALRQQSDLMRDASHQTAGEGGVSGDYGGAAALGGGDGGAGGC